MRYLLFAGVVLLLAGACHSRKAAESKAPATTQAKDSVKKKLTELEEFLARFEQAVLTHNKTLVLDFLDRDYKVEEHDKKMNGNTDLFLSKFFCGYQTNGQGHRCQKFAEITGITRVELLPNEANYTVTYHVSVKNATINISWLVMAKRQGGGKMTYGIVGTQG